MKHGCTRITKMSRPYPCKSVFHPWLKFAFELFAGFVVCRVFGCGRRPRRVFRVFRGLSFPLFNHPPRSPRLIFATP